MFKIIFTISYFCAYTFKMNNLIKHLYYQISILSKASNSIADMQGTEYGEQKIHNERLSISIFSIWMFDRW